MPGILNTNGLHVSGTVAELEDWDTIQSSPDAPLAQVELEITDGGVLDLSDELHSSVDTNSDGVNEDRSAWVEASDYGNTITTGTGNDVIYGGYGNDTLNGGDGDDVIYSYNPEDYDYYFGGIDVIDGGAGNDSIRVIGSSGTVNGGAGDDTITVSYVSGTIDGGTGTDTLAVNGYGSVLDTSAISNVEVLRLGYGYISATAAQLEGFDRIESAYFDPTDSIEIDLVGAGVADLSDELGNQSAYVYASDEGNTIVAGSGNDYLEGGLGNDVLRGGAGDDEIRDVVYSYDEVTDEEVLVASGTNVLDGGAGDDSFYVGPLTKGTVDGGTGNDTLYAFDELSSDLTIGSVETLAVDGSIKATTAQLDSFDHIMNAYYDYDYVESYSATLDIELAGAGFADLSDELGSQSVRITTSSLGNGIVTGSGDDILIGGTGNDWLAASAGDDRLKGGDGDDTLVGGDGADYLNGGKGTNTVSYVGATSVVVSLDGSLTATNDAIGDVFHGVANLSGSSAGDRLRGNDSANLVDGGAGDDRLEGRDDDDRLEGGDGNDTLLGGEGNDTLVGGAGKDTLNGGEGADDFIFSFLADSGRAATARDTIVGFTKGQDDIVVSAIDAKAGAGNQAFELDVNGTFSAGEIRQTVVSAGLLIEFNTDSDNAAEMSILLANVHNALGASDFVF